MSPGQRSFHLLGFDESGLVDDIWECCECDLRLSLYLEHVRQRGAWRYSAVTRTFPKGLYEIKGSHDALQCLPWSVVCLPVLQTYCGFCVNLLQPMAWTGETYIEYDIVIVTMSTWFSLTMRMELRTLRESSVQTVLSDWGDQFLCNKMLRHYEDNAFIIKLVYLDVFDTGYTNHNVDMVWIFDLNFAPYCLKS